MPQFFRLGHIVSFVVLQLIAAATPSAALAASYSFDEAHQLMRKWLIVGPIPAHHADEAPSPASARKSGFETDLLIDYGGESAVEPKRGGEISVRKAQRQWQPVVSNDEGVDLAKILGRNEWAIAYASATVNVEDKTTAFLAIGSDDAVRVWLNGELVHDHWTERPLDLDDDLVAVHLQPGRNRLVIKVCNTVGEWGFACRFLSRQAQAERMVQAASRGDEAQILSLLEHGVDVNAKNKHGLTAIHAAEMRGYPHVVKLLESRGAQRDVEFSEEHLVEQLLREWTPAEGPGIAVLVSKGGNVIYRNAFGLANIEHDVPVSTETKFRIGSVTKQFAACAILKLQEEGKLGVDDRLSKFLPSFPRGDEVTIHHLLTHTSGIHSFTANPSFFTHVASAATSQEMIDSFKDHEFDFAPGAEWRYNNSGYFLLGTIIEEISGKPFGEYLRETFFAPLDMDDTGVHTATAILKHEATGYSHSNGATTKALNWDMSRAGAAGNLYSTIDDLYRWNEAVFGGNVLSDESLATALSPVKLENEDKPAPPYGYGWMIDEHRGLKRIAHSGGLHGFLTNLVRYPEVDATIVVFHNCSPPIPKLTPATVTDLLANAFLWREMQPQPRYTVDETVDPKTYDAYLGRYEYGPGAVMTITREGERLFAQLTGQAKYEIFPAGEARFFWKVVDAQVEFIRDGEGHVTAARHTQAGRTFDAPKLKDEATIEVSNDVLDSYVGKYRYQGLGVLTVRREGNRLLAQMTGQSELEIFPKSETEFFWKVVPAEIRFVRDAEGKVTKAIHQQGGGTIEAQKIE